MTYDDPGVIPMAQRWHKAENDYRGILALDEGSQLSIAVIIPAHQAPDVLERTLAGLATQEGARPTEVCIVDDDSPVPLDSIVASFSDRLNVRYLRRSFEGFGAGPGRNLGVAETSSDLLLFLDSDCIPDRGLLAAHARWHRRVENAVVVGSRIDVDASGFVAADVDAAGVAPESMGLAVNPWEEVESGDWRPEFMRKNRRLVIDDTAYRAALSNNLSMGRQTFEVAGGFSSDFIDWGSEDTEFGWRLFQDGNFIIPDESGVVYHQIQNDDPAARIEHRKRARAMNRPLLADSIPNRWYRRTPGSAYTVPQLTWVIDGQRTPGIDRRLRWIDDVGWVDNEIIVVGDPDEISPWRSRARASDRFKLVETGSNATVGDILDGSRGEFMIMVGDVLAVDRSVAARVMKRFVADPRVGVVRVPYVDETGAVARRIEDLASHDDAVGFPGFAALRRRALAKHDRDGSLSVAVSAATATERTGLLSNPKVKVAQGLTQSRLPDLKMMSQLGPREVARMASSRVRSPDGAPAGSASESRPGISYVGFTGRANLGDEAIMAAIDRLLPGFDIRREHPDPIALMIGGGTIINSKNYYLTRVLREDRPGLPLFTFAPGVRDPDFWGVTEPMDDWMSIFRSAEPMTVRGPDSARHLATLGWPGAVRVIGDPALSLAPVEVPASEGEAIVAPLNTNGYLIGGSDAAVFSALAKECERLADLGMNVTLMSSFPEDDRWILEMERMIDAPVEYFCGYASLEETLARIAGASLVIGERLHASILAAAMRTPFVALAYRPKTLDFIRSIGAEDLALTTGELASLEPTVDSVLADANGVTRIIADGVDPLVDLQRQHAEYIAHSLGFPLAGD